MIPAADASALGPGRRPRRWRATPAGPATVEGRDWYLTVYNVPWEVVIVGAVHIAQALGHLALAAGYRVRVIDPRPAYAGAERLCPAWPC